MKTMKIHLFGHDYKYAAEQMLLTLFPDERPEYPAGEPAGDRMEVRLSRSGGAVEASCLLTRGENRWEGRDSAPLSPDAGALERDRIGQRLVKNAIYRAALRSGVPRPVWGALTGVRPGKVLARILEEEPDRAAALERFEREYDVSGERAALCMDTAVYTAQAKAALGERDVCLYVGIPFCPTRCSYCSFVSQSVEKSRELIVPFTEALKKEIRATAQAAAEAGLRPVSVYFGGGTPTTLTAAQLEEVFSELERSFDLSSVRETTVEAGRPETISPEKLAVMREHAVTRISVNPQTMSDRVLDVIGRRHTAADILSAVELVRAAGAFQINMDLIAGLPSDTPEGFEETLRAVCALEPENVTVHTLSLKKGSRITLEGTKIPSGEEVGRMLDFSAETLRKNGFEPYYLYRQKFMSGGFENTGWTKKGFANLYNICIMEEICSILAMGGGGSTKLVRPGDGRNIRIMDPKYPAEYIGAIDRICADRKKITEFFSKENDYGISAERPEL